MTFRIMAFALVITALFSFAAGSCTASKIWGTHETEVVEAKPDTVYVEKGYYVDTVYKDLHCTPVYEYVYDTILKEVKETVFLGYEIKLYKYIFKDSLLTASLWANYVDTSSFTYSLRRPLVRTVAHKNLFFLTVTPDGTYYSINYGRFFWKRYFLSAGYAPLQKQINLSFGIAF